MPDPITWYALGRTVDDAETILEGVDAKILTHNLDPSAHGQENESVYEHRVAPLLDHLQYTIYNIKLNPATRVYKAIVSPGIDADFQTIQSAIDWCDLYNGGRILIKQGTYQISADIILPSNIILEGEDMDLTVLDFDNGNFHIHAPGTSGAHKRNIEIRELQIKDCGKYDDGTILLEYCDDCDIENIKINGAHYAEDPTTWGLRLSHCTRINIEHNQILDTDYGISVSNSPNCNIEFNYMYDIDNYLLSIVSSNYTKYRHNLSDMCGNILQDTTIYLGGSFDSSVIDSNFVLRCRTSGIWNEGASMISISNNVITPTEDAANGIALNSVKRCIITGNRIYDFSEDGIVLGGNADKNVITGNCCTDNGQYGINISINTCDNNVVVANVVTSNISGGVNDSGTGTENAHNVT